MNFLLIFIEFLLIGRTCDFEKNADFAYFAELLFWQLLICAS